MSRAKAVFIPPAKLVVVARSSYPKQKAEHPPSGRCSAFSGFVQAMQPMLRSKNSQKVRLNALNRVVVTHTLPVSTPSWPICFAIT